MKTLKIKLGMECSIYNNMKRNKFSKRMANLCSENYKILLREIKGDLTTLLGWCYSPGHRGCNASLIKTPAGFCAEINKLILRLI